MSTNMDLPGLHGLEGLYEDIYDDALPVVAISASQSLHASAAGGDAISTGLPRLDWNLAPEDDEPGGILRGHLTEIYGPPAVGKSSLALNIAQHALHQGRVLWIDTAFPLPHSRFEGISVRTDDFIHVYTPTLAHLLALLKRPPQWFSLSETSLIVIDPISEFLQSDLPSSAELREEFDEGKLVDKENLHWLLGRKQTVVNELARTLARLAAQDIAVLAINQTQTESPAEDGNAIIVPVLSGGAWENTVQTRLAMYCGLPDQRFVEVVKRSGLHSKPAGVEPHVAFEIDSDGLYECEMDLGACDVDAYVPLSELEGLESRTPTGLPFSSPPSSDLSSVSFSGLNSPEKNAARSDSPSLSPASPSPEPAFREPDLPAPDSRPLSFMPPSPVLQPPAQDLPGSDSSSLSSAPPSPKGNDVQQDRSGSESPPLSSVPPSPELEALGLDFLRPDPPADKFTSHDSPGGSLPELPTLNSAQPEQPSPTPIRKRKVEEVADSQDEDEDSESGA